MRWGCDGCKHQSLAGGCNHEDAQNDYSCGPDNLAMLIVCFFVGIPMFLLFMFIDYIQN